MATVHQTWDPDAITTVLSTELNSLGSAAISALGTQYDNATNCFLYAMFEVTATFGTGPSADSTLDLFLVPAPDGTNYDDGSSSVYSQNHAVGGWTMRNVNTQQKIALWGVPLPPTKFKLQVVNNTDQAIAASGNLVKMIAYGLKAA
jgi:hypothetical protein